MDPNPLADDLRIPPLATETTPKDAQDLRQRQGPMLMMQRAAESAGQLDRQRLQRPRTDGDRLRLRLTYCGCIFVFHILNFHFLSPQQTQLRNKT